MGYPKTHFAAATAAVVDQFITSTDMKRGSYGAVANSGAMPTAGARKVTITLTRQTGVDTTLGTVTITGTDIHGAAASETMTPLDNTTATSTKWFKTVNPTGVLGGSTWVSDGDADHIQVGCAAAALVAEGNGVLHAISVNTAANGAVTIADAGGTIATLKAGIAEGVYVYDVNWYGYLSVTAAAATDLTIIHSDSSTYTYSM
jgi:hypothetical protein